ncbi:MAG: hypothetical protein DCE86_04035, partial [Flavobacteriaceae bacterium]
MQRNGIKTAFKSLAMKKYIFSLVMAAVLFYTNSISAQQWSIGARGGLSIPNLT